MVVTNDISPNPFVNIPEVEKLEKNEGGGKEEPRKNHRAPKIAAIVRGYCKYFLGPIFMQDEKIDPPGHR